MRELIELRMSTEDAKRYLPPGIGEDVGHGVHKLLLEVEDPWVEKLQSIEAEYRARGTTLFSTCEVRRHYTPRELLAAEYLQVSFGPFFRPTGEECGTLYDESAACPRCGAGARQVNELHLEPRRIPKSRELSHTLGGEYVISSRLAGVLRAHGITGYELRPVVSRGGRPIAEWHQFLVSSATAELVPPTRTGNSYMAPEPDPHRCPEGHVIGFRQLSALTLSRASLGGQDWVLTRQRFGRRVGLFHPYEGMLVSQRLYRLLKEQKVRYLHAEWVHLV
jgi:hypothetical protein